MQTIHPLNQVRRLCSIGLVSLLVLSGAAFAQVRSAPPADIYLYKGADREHRLMAGARKEGTVSIYTSLNLKDSQPITEAFEKKYGIKVPAATNGSAPPTNGSVTGGALPLVAGNATPEFRVLLEYLRMVSSNNV
jgi:iron(III) transport system substrate-binding protein